MNFIQFWLSDETQRFKDYYCLDESSTQYGWNACKREIIKILEYASREDLEHINKIIKEIEEL